MNHPLLSLPMRILCTFTRSFDRFIEHGMAASRSAVEDPERFHRVRRWAMVRAVSLSVAALSMVATADLNTWQSLVVFALMFYASRGAFTWMQQAHAFMGGYLRGRGTMVSSLGEAARRDIEIDDWIDDELERDEVMMMRAYGSMPIDERPPL